MFGNLFFPFCCGIFVVDFYIFFYIFFVGVGGLGLGLGLSVVWGWSNPCKAL
jgi:hypothetical protein